MLDLLGKNIIFTGKMMEKREVMMKEAEEIGANPQKSINKKTDILVMGEDVGQKKIDFAEANNIEMISEQEFWESVYILE